MHVLGPLAALLGIEVDALVDRIKRNAVAYGATALFALIGLVFLLVAAHTALSDWLGPLWSALIIAGIALLIAAIIWLRARAIEQARQREIVAKRRSTDTTTLITTAALAAIPMLFKNPAMRLAAVPIGVIVGYMLLGKRNDPDGKP